MRRSRCASLAAPRAALPPERSLQVETKWICESTGEYLQKHQYRTMHPYGGEKVCMRQRRLRDHLSEHWHSRRSCCPRMTWRPSSCSAIPVRAPCACTLRVHPARWPAADYQHDLRSAAAAGLQARHLPARVPQPTPSILYLP